MLGAAAFLTFGPGAMRRLSIHLFLLGIAGLLAAIAGGAQYAWFIAVFGSLTFLCMIGSAQILGYGTMMHAISEKECNDYFNSGSHAICEDGYLQYLRVISVLCYYVVAAVVVLVLTSTAGPQASYQESADANQADQEGSKQSV